MSELDPGAAIKRTRRFPTTLLLALTLVTAPAAFLAWVRLGLDERVDGIQISPEALIMPVSPTFDDAQVSATATLTWTTGGQLPSPGLDGVVTAVYITEGTIVREGDAVIQVNGIDRIAARLPAPFFRPLVSRDVGADVEDLQGFLQRTGRYSDEVDGVYGATTSAAVKTLESDIGVNKPTGVFEASMVVWLPSDIFEVGQVEVHVGDLAPQVGSAMAQAAANIVRADVSYAPTSVHSSRPLVFRAGELTVPLNADGRSISEEGLKALTATTSTEVSTLEGFVALAEPREFWLVPTTSVVVGEGGNTCVWLAMSGLGDYSASEVLVSSSTPTGSSLLAGGVEKGDRVLVNPFEVLESPACP